VGGEERTGDADPLARAHRHQLLLEQARAAALDAVQVRVHLVGAVKGHVQPHVVGERVQRHRVQPGLDDGLARLVARRHEDDAVGAVRRRGAAAALRERDAAAAGRGDGGGGRGRGRGRGLVGERAVVRGERVGDGLDDVPDRRAAADADVRELRAEVVGDGTAGGEALGRLDGVFLRGVVCGRI
jgi:hypothetical protein